MNILKKVFRKIRFRLKPYTFRRKNGTSFICKMIILMFLLNAIFVFTPPLKVVIVRAVDPTYIYVGLNGTDDMVGDRGSKNNPFRTIDYAYESLGTTYAPFVMNIYAGEYDERVYDYADRYGSGNTTFTSVIQAFERDTVIWCDRNDSGSDRGAWQPTQLQHWVIRNITFSNVSRFACFINMQTNTYPITNGTIQNCTFTNISCSAVRIKGINQNQRIENITVEDCTTNDICNCWNINSQEGISLSWAYYCYIRNNTMSNCYKNNIDVKAYCSYIRVYDNVINTTHGTPPAALTWGSGGGLYIDTHGTWSHHIYFYRNIVFGNYSSCHIGSEDADTGTHNNSVFNNLFVVNQSMQGVQYPFYTQKNNDGGGARNYIRYTNFYHNTLIGGHGNFRIMIDSRDFIGCNITNNIMANATTDAVVIDNETGMNINGYNNLYCGQSSEFYGTNALNGSAEFTGVNNYHLKTGSAAIDTAINAGIRHDLDNNARPNLYGYDVGCYEAYDSTHWAGEYNYRRRIYIESDLIDTTLTDFTVLIPINSTVGQKCDGGNSITFVGMNNITVYNHETEYFNSSSTSYVWAKIPRLTSAADTSFWMYYGNENATGYENVTGTWDNNYIMVQHMNSTAQLEDSTRYNNDGDRYNSPTRVSSLIGYAQDFDAGNDHFRIPDDNTLDCNKTFTIEAWLNVDDNGAHRCILSKWDGLVGGNQQFYLSKHADDETHAQITNAGSASVYSGDNTAKQNRWYYTAATAHNPTTTFTLYLNTSKVDEANIITGNIYNNEPLYIGRRGLDQNFDGTIEEVRISNIARNWSWINATFHTTNQTDTFLYWGNEEENINISVSAITPAIGATGINLYTPLSFTVSHTNGSSMDVTWYTNVSGAWASFATNTSVNNGTYKQYNLDFNEREHYYWWRFDISDGLETYTSGNLYFETEPDYIPGNPTNISASFSAGGALNITWENDAEADTVTVVSRNDSYPATHTDGWVRQNISATWFNDTTITGERYFTLFSYNGTDGSKWSPGAQVSWGGLGLNTFSEDLGLPLTFDIEITNEDSSTTYQATGLTNTHYVDTDNIPFGADTVFRVSAANYQDSIYYYNINQNNYYNLSFYLSRNISTTHLYYFRVEDHSGQPLQDARVNISVNVGGSYVTKGLYKTDSNGYGQVELNSSRTYQVTITKSGYETELTKWIPDPDFYGIYYPKIFRMELSEHDYENETTYTTQVTFEGHIYTNNTMVVNYTDAMAATVSTNICIYEINTSTNATTVLMWDNRSGASSFSFSLLINRANCYEVALTLNHGTFGNITDTLFLCGPGRPHQQQRNQGDDENLFTSVLRNNPLGWINLIGIIVLLACLFSFGQENAGVSLMVTGGVFLFINVIIGWAIIGVLLCILFMVFGALAQWRTYRRLHPT